MKFNGWTGFEDMARACGYTTDNNANTGQTSSNSTNNSNNMGCSDIPNGFQSLNPELFVTIGEILGNIIAGNIPFNVQNALGNWLELVGQVILTYNTQQQYFQGGPGRYFDPMYYNVSNPFCTTNSNANQNKSSNANYDQKFIENQINKIRELELRLNDVICKIDKIQSKIEDETS